jgi:hypothetical protein
MIPFFILAFPLKFFIFGFSSNSYFTVEKVLASLYVCFFPQIKKLFLNNQDEALEMEDILNSFEIEPKKIMTALPFLVQQRKTRWEDYFITLWICFCIVALGSIVSFLPFTIFKAIKQF